MKTTKTTKSIIALTLLAVTGAASGQQSSTRQITQGSETIGQIQSSVTESMTKQAEAWGITTEELERYQDLNSEGSIYSTLGKDLTVLEVLGMEARTDAERQRYARLMVEQETRYQKNLIAFESARMDVLKTQYPDMAMWKSEEELRQKSLPELLQGLARHHDKRLVIYASADSCNSKCQDYITKVRKSASRSTRVDIFFTNTRGSDQTLRKAVAAVGLSSEDIDGTNLTVNHDKGYYARMQVEGVKTLPMAVKLDSSGKVTPVDAW